MLKLATKRLLLTNLLPQKQGLRLVWTWSKTDIVYSHKPTSTKTRIKTRDYYNDGWKPDWKDSIDKFVILYQNDEIITETYYYARKLLAFKTKKLRDEFLNNFKDLIEIAKPLL